MSIKSLFSYDILKHLIGFYQRIPSLYKTTFWTIFIALNIVFAYHTSNFLWGNHEWVYMRTGITWRNFWYEARFTETLPYALFGFELLPILLNLFSFTGISLSLLSLSVYWKLPKEKWIYIGFGLMMAFIPYNLSWLYHVAQSSFFWGCSIIIAALTVLDKITDGKISRWWHLAIIFLLWFVLGFSAAFINTIFICFIGRCLIDLCQGKNLFSLFKKGIIALIDVTAAAVLLKGTIYLADKYGYLGDNFYNVNMIKLSEVPSKLMEVAGYTLEQFTYTYPFFEKPCLFMMWIISILALLTLLWKLPRQRWILHFIAFIIGIIGLLFASQFAIFISENRIKLQFMFRLTGFFSLYFIFAFMLAVLCHFWRKIFLRNILFLLMVVITWLFVQRDMYAMRVWKQGLDAENKLFDRITARIENIPEFNYNKHYRVAIIGDPSLRIRYYQGTYKDGDASMLSWSYRAPWTFPAYLNFYAPSDYIQRGFQNAWGFKYTENLFTHFSNDTLDYIAKHAAPWPAPGSVMIQDDIILIFINSAETNTFKKLLQDYIRERQTFETSGYPKGVQVFHPHWRQIHTMRFMTTDRILCIGRNDTATVLKFDDNTLVVRWDDYGTETFINNGSGVYEYAEKGTDIPSEIDVIMASHKDWLPAWRPQELRFISKNKIMRASNNDIATVEKHTDTELILNWYAYGKERFLKDEHGVYRFQEKL